MTKTETMANNLAVEILNWIKSEVHAHSKDNLGETFMIGYRTGGRSEDGLSSIEDDAHNLLKALDPNYEGKKVLD